MWPKSEGIPFKPPPYKIMSRRPKKYRRKDADEEPRIANRYKFSRKGAKMQSNKCYQYGHNKRSCQVV